MSYRPAHIYFNYRILNLSFNLTLQFNASRAVHSCLPSRYCCNACIVLKPKREIKLGGLALLVFPVGFFFLGCWQVKRRIWKKDLLERLKERYYGDPVELPEDLRELNNMEFSRIKVRGAFDHSDEFIIPTRNRRDPKFVEHRSHFMFDEYSPVGANVVTPFRVKDRGYKILINRGWVPKEKIDPKTRRKGQIEGEVEIVGVNRLNEKRPPLVMKNDPIRNLWFYRDVNSMAKFHNTAPVYLEADAECTIDGGPLGGQTNVEIPDNHAAYIVTWWSLCALTTYMWLSLFYF
uniref:SURF1-like protein n=1 Tax=Trichuris muris TaxID=70415 RepID=A0A5S6QZH3_TRIMR